MSLLQTKEQDKNLQEQLNEEEIVHLKKHHNNNNNKAKWLSEEALQIPIKRREVKKQRRKGKIFRFECRVPKKSKER